MNTPEDALNLSCFLNILDGIIELYGIMIIMTTNYPERIDEALIRPGRFDFKYEFKKATKNIIKEMIQFKYELSEKEMLKYIKLLNVKDYTLSQAEIQSICFKNQDVKDCINEIVLASNMK
jgi:chaperone BCS1